MIWSEYFDYIILCQSWWYVFFTQSTAECSRLTQAIKTEADGFSLPVVLHFNVFCTQDKSQSPRAARHATRQRSWQSVDQVLPAANQDVPRKHNTYSNERVCCCYKKTLVINGIWRPVRLRVCVWVCVCEIPSAN